MENDRTKRRVIEQEMKEAYLDYSMSVIVGRALPDVRDGLKPVHRRILFAMNDLGMTHNKPFKKCARIVGECFVKGTQIFTPQGLISIEHLTKNNKVYTQNDTKQITELYIMPKQKLLEVKLENGFKNTCTKNQMFKVFTKDLKFIWKKAINLTKEDYIVLRATNPKVKDYIKLKKELIIDEDLAYFLGIFLADGWIDRDKKRGYHRIVICNDSLDVLNGIKKILKAKFKINININKQGSIHSIRINNNELNKKLISYFNFENKYSYNIQIPPVIFTSPASVINSFISGFIDGDGSVNKNKNTLQMGSISQSFIQDLQTLLFNQGILSRIHIQKAKEKSYKNRIIKSNNQLYSLEITGYSLEKIISLIDLKNKNKKQRLNFKRFIPSKYEEIPYLTKPIFKEFSKKHLGGGWYLDKNNKKIRLGIKYPNGTKIRYSKDLIEQFKIYSSNVKKINILDKLNTIGSQYYNLIKEILDNHLYFVKVKNISEIYEDITYDIQVKDEHEFVANGMLVHNCLGKYHPHGDVAVYDSLVRMAQDFSLRYQLIKGQGNFGNVDGDSAASMRYTEAKLSKISEELLVDLNKETVNWTDNFDGSLKEPVVLPGKLPNLMINGSSGIAVGMATNIPPHNIKEVCNSIINLIDNPNAEVVELMTHIKGPDFPTGGIICGRSGIISAYKTGRGKLQIRARADIEVKKEKQAIIVTEIPYQVNKSQLIENIAKLVNDKIIEGISDIRDESDRDGMRIVIEIKRGSEANVVLNQLFKHTQLETTFGIILLALDKNIPRVMNIKEIFTHYINHRKEVIIRRTQFDLNKAEARAHILEGLQIALKNIDPIVKGIKASKTVELAKKFLMETYSLSELQAIAILDMKLQKLTSLETEKLQNEFQDLIKLITELKSILESERKVLELIKNDLLEIIENYGDSRKTEITDAEEEMEDEDLIPDEEVAVIMTSTGYIKRMPLEEYRLQRRGGVGVKGTEKKEEEDVDKILVTTTHHYLLCFSATGQVYWLKIYQIPEAGKYAKGKAIINLLELKPNDVITTVIPIKEFTDNHFLIMCTKLGLIKKTPLSEYSHPRKGGIVGIKLREEDELVTVKLTPGTLKFLIGTKKGNAVRFDEDDVRDVGRNSQGVKGITLEKGDEVIGMEVAIDTGQILTITENGFGKRTDIQDYRLITRGGKGVINIKTSDRNGNVVAIKTVKDNDEVIVISKNGIIIRISVRDVPNISRNTQGVKIMKLREGDKVSTVERVKYSHPHIQEEQNEQSDNTTKTE